MFKLIGGLVVYGFALYGFTTWMEQFSEQHKA